MDGGAIPRPAPAQSAAPVRSDSAPARPSAPVQSAPEKVVQPVGETEAVRLDVGQINQRIVDALTAVDRKQDFDKSANSVVVSWVDEESGDVVRQFPTEQQLQIRAYWRETLRQVDADRAAGKPSDDIIV